MIKTLMILTIAVFGYSFSANAHHEHCYEQYTTAVARARCTANLNQVPLSGERLQAFTEKLYEEPMFQKGQELANDLYYYDNVDGLVSGKLTVDYGVYGHGPGGDRNGAFVATQVVGRFTAFPVEMQVVGLFQLPSVEGGPEQSETKILDILEVSVFRR